MYVKEGNDLTALRDEVLAIDVLFTSLYFLTCDWVARDGASPDRLLDDCVITHYVEGGQIAVGGLLAVKQFLALRNDLLAYLVRPQIKFSRWNRAHGVALVDGDEDLLTDVE